MSWSGDTPGLLRLPSGRTIRGRGVSRPLPAGPTPTFGVYLLGTAPPPVDWESRWVRWPDFWLPRDKRLAAVVLREALERAGMEGERVEVACAGGKGRTGTALACVAIMDGVPAREAVAYVREHYSPHAVETPWQRWFVARFRPGV